MASTLAGQFRDGGNKSAAIVATELASTRVHVGFPLPSRVSNLTDKLTLGDKVFTNASFCVLPEAPLPKSYSVTLVFAVTSHIF